MLYIILYNTINHNITFWAYKILKLLKLTRLRRPVSRVFRAEKYNIRIPTANSQNLRSTQSSFSRCTTAEICVPTYV